MILLCYEKLYEVIEAFEQATGWKIVLWDSDCVRTVCSTSYEANPFCCELQRISGNSLCRRSDEELLARCRASRRVERHACHAGFTDLCVPVLKGEQILGFLMFGQIRLDGSTPPTQRTLDLFCDSSEGATLYERTPVASEEKLFSVIKVATMLASYILSEQMIGEEHSEVAARLEKYVEEHLAESLTVERISRDLHLSRSTLYRLFERNVGVGVKDYVSSVRIARAKRALIEGDLAVSEIAATCGFLSVSYFCRVFKMKTGKTPFQYRNIHKRR